MDKCQKVSGYGNKQSRLETVQRKNSRLAGGIYGSPEPGYISLLSDSKKGASEKFWELEERIRRDKKTPGVQLELRKSEVAWDLAVLLNDHVIQINDLDAFSNELVETGERLAGIDRAGQ